MIAKWVDITVVIFLIFAIWRGFQKGLIREVFSLIGALLAVAVAFQSYQEISLHLMESYPLIEWQAQIIAFVAVVLGISLTAVLFGYVWSKVIHLSPFAVLDHIAGAGFGVVKVGLVVIGIVLFLNSLSIPAMDQVLADSITVQQVNIIWPQLHNMLDQNWPAQVNKPGWLFPTSQLSHSST